MPDAFAAIPVLNPGWFKDTVIGIEVEQFIGLGVLLAIVIVTRFVITRTLHIYISRRVVTTEHAFWHREQTRLYRPILGLLIAVALLVGIPALDFDLNVEDVTDLFGRLLGALSIVWLAYRGIDIFADFLARRATKSDTKMDDQLVPIIRTSLKIVVSAIGLLFVLSNLDVNIASLIAGLGLTGLAVALAAQDSIKNLLGGITIFADKPFQVGDWVVVGDVEGTVEEVGLRSTRIRTFYNSIVSVPNAVFTENEVDNMGQRRWRRYKTTLGLAYHTSPDQVQAFVEGVRAIIRANPDMRTDYYIVEFHGFGASSLDILVYCFIDAPDWNAELRTRHVLNLDLMRLAQRLSVDFAFPTQTLHVTSMPGQAVPVAAVPARDQLAGVVDDFGPQGEAGQRTDQPITRGYDNG